MQEDYTQAIEKGIAYFTETYGPDWHRGVCLETLDMSNPTEDIVAQVAEVDYRDTRWFEHDNEAQGYGFSYRRNSGEDADHLTMQWIYAIAALQNLPDIKPEYSYDVVVESIGFVCTKVPNYFFALSMYRYYAEKHNHVTMFVHGNGTQEILHEHINTEAQDDEWDDETGGYYETDDC